MECGQMLGKPEAQEALTDHHRAVCHRVQGVRGEKDITLFFSDPKFAVLCSVTKPAAGSCSSSNREKEPSQAKRLPKVHR